jgi:hypothetical protein
MPPPVDDSVRARIPAAGLDRGDPPVLHDHGSLFEHASIVVHGDDGRPDDGHTSRHGTPALLSASPLCVRAVDSPGRQPSSVMNV